MEGQVKQVDRWTSERLDCQTCRKKKKWMNGLTYKWTSGWLGRELSGMTVDGWIGYKLTCGWLTGRWWVKQVEEWTGGCLGR